jgi:hypothetical protein
MLGLQNHDTRTAVVEVPVHVCVTGKTVGDKVDLAGLSVKKHAVP